MDDIKFFELDRLYYGSVLENNRVHEDVFYSMDSKYCGLNCLIASERILGKVSLKEKLEKLGLEHLIKNSSFKNFEFLTKDQIRKICKVIKTKSKMSESEIERIDEMSELVTNYISDLLGLNIVSRPLTDVSSTFSNISNVLVTGLKEFKFRELLKPIIEVELYQCYGEPCSQIYSCQDGLIDSRISACLNKVGIKKDNVLKNQFSVRVNSNQISILDSGINQYVVCYEKNEKVKRI